MSVTLLIAAVLSRFMLPEDYGTFRQVIFVYYTLLMLFSLGMPRAYSYFLARAPIEEGRDVVRRLNILLVALASVFSLSLLLGADLIAESIGNAALAPNLRYFSVVPMLLMPVLGVENILTVYGYARVVTGYVFLSRCFMVVGAVVPVILLDEGVSGAVIGFVAASFFSCVTGLYLAFFPFRGIMDLRTNLSLHEVIRFIMPVFVASIFGFVLTSASQFCVSRFFGVEAFAIFANGYKELPFAGMVLGATSRVLLPEFTRIANGAAASASILSLWKTVIVKSASLIYPLSIFFCFFATEVMTLLYGSFYTRSAILFRLITLVNLMRIVPCGSIMFAMGHGGAFAKAHMGAAALIVVLDWLCISCLPSLWAIAAIATFCVVLCIFMQIRYISGFLRVSLGVLMPWLDMLKILSASVLSCIIVKSLGNMLQLPFDGILSLSVSAILCVAVYVPFALLLKLDYKWLSGMLKQGFAAVGEICSETRYGIGK